MVVGNSFGNYMSCVLCAIRSSAKHPLGDKCSRVFLLNQMKSKGGEVMKEHDLISCTCTDLLQLCNGTSFVPYS